MSKPQFPDPAGRREVLEPGATAHKAGASLEGRLRALEQGAAPRTTAAGSYAAGMHLANSGSPTHTSSGSYQKVGSGGGTATWVSDFDKRPSGVSAQVDTATNKRIDIRNTGLYWVAGRVGFNSITAAKTTGVSVHKNGADIGFNNYVSTGATSSLVVNASGILSLTAGDYLELFAIQDDSASEAYITSVPEICSMQISYLGPAS